MDIIKVKNEVFDFDVEWIIADDTKEAIEYVENNGVELGDLGNAQGFTSYKGNSLSYLYLNDRSDYILIHECIHIIQGILARKGVSTDYENTEVLAYNVDWLYRSLLYKYYKKNKNDKYKLYGFDK